MVINADGLDIDCCRNVRIAGCDIDCGDDCIALRANETHAGRAVPCEHVTVENCLLRSPACAVRVGVGNGILKNCTLKNLQIRDSAIGVGICPSYTPGQCVNIKNVLFEDVTFEGKSAFILIPLWGAVRNEDDPEIKPVRNIIFRNFQGKCSGSSFIGGPVAEEIFSGIRLEDVTLTMCAEPERLSEYRWPFEENGVLDVYRMPELDTTRFYGRSEGGHAPVLHKP